MYVVARIGIGGTCHDLSPVSWLISSGTSPGGFPSSENGPPTAQFR
jgi:hypothetical protein